MSKELILKRAKVITDKGLSEEQSKTILHLGDLHEGINSINKWGEISNKLFYKFLENLDNIDVVVINGDNANGAKSYKNATYKKLIDDKIEILSEKAPVIIGKGNHDMWGTDAEIDELYKGLGKGNPNVYVLDNNYADVNGVRFLGFSPRFESYDIFNQGKKSDRMVVEDYRTVESNFKFASDKPNIFISHAPHAFNNALMLKMYSDLYEYCVVNLSAHIHDGFMPTWLDRMIKSLIDNPNLLKYEFIQKCLEWASDKGIWESPNTGFIAKYCRGARFVGNGEIGKTILLNENSYKLEDDKFIMVKEQPSTIIDATGENRNKTLSFTTEGFSKLPLTPTGSNPHIGEIILAAPKYSDGDLEDKKYMKMGA